MNKTYIHTETVVQCAYKGAADNDRQTLEWIQKQRVKRPRESSLICTMERGIAWSDKKYDIREFAELFYDRLPLIARIEELNDNDEPNSQSVYQYNTIIYIHLKRSLHLLGLLKLLSLLCV